jgi:protein-S-isoprenylcysteine O-methyltransferase Ste14
VVELRGPDSAAKLPSVLGLPAFAHGIFFLASRRHLWRSPDCLILADRTLGLGSVGALPRLDLRVVYAFGVLADEWLLHFAHLSGSSIVSTTALFHAAVAAACLLPAQRFSRWTRERTHLSARVWMHFIFHSMLLLGVLSLLILSLADDFQAPFLRGSIANKLFLQLLLIPGVLLASAMREFYLAGGTPMPADAPLKLVTTGPYAYVANPMQIGKFGVLAGWAFFWSSPAILGRAATHMNLVFAFFGWMISLPVISWLAGLIADAGVARSPEQPCAPPAIHPAPPAINPKATVTVSAPKSIVPRPTRVSRTSAPQSPAMVWIIAGQSELLVLLVLLFLIWKGTTSEMIWQLKHGSAGSRFKAAGDLALSGPKAIEAAPALRDAVDDPDAQVQRLAADALLRMRAWSELNSCDWVRKADAYSITSATTDIANTYPAPLEALPLLQNVLLNYPEPTARQQAVMTLGRYGERAVPILMAASDDRDPTVRSWVQTVLDQIQGRPPFRGR